MTITSEELQKSFHYLYPDELPELKRLASLLPPNPVIINIGAGAGTSGLAFMETRPDAMLFTIDIEDRDSPLGSLFSERKVFEKAGLSHLKGKQWVQVHGDSKEVMWLFDNDSVDLVFIDGDHSYEGCKSDIENWIPHLKGGGFLVIHDYNKQLLAENPDGPHPKPWPGVNMAVDELINGGWKPFGLVDSLIAFQFPGGDFEDSSQEMINPFVEDLDWIESLGDDDAFGAA